MSRESIYKESVIELRKQGLGYGEIANKLGITKANARHHCVENGLIGFIGKGVFGQGVCVQCGKSFEKRMTEQLYCSKECRHRRRYPIKEKTVIKKEVIKKITFCRCCGVEIKQSKHSKRVYCSEDCHKKWVKDNPKYTKECPHCGKEFKTNSVDQIYCSRNCSDTIKKDVVNQYGTLKEREKVFFTKFNDKFKDEFVYVDGFVNVDSKVRCKCVKCGKFKMIGAECVRKDYRVECECVRIERNNAIQNQRAVKKEEKKINDRSEKYRKYIQTNIARISNIKIVWIKMRKCQYCGELFESIKDRKTCSSNCIKKLNQQGRGEKRIKRMKSNGKYEWNITIPKLIKRDKVCKLCGLPVDMHDIKAAKGTMIAGDNYPSIDHIIPVSKGGTHTWDNVQLAHRGCNTKKNNSTDVVARVGKIQLSLNI